MQRKIRMVLLKGNHVLGIGEISPVEQLVIEQVFTRNGWDVHTHTEISPEISDFQEDDDIKENTDPGDEE